MVREAFKMVDVGIREGLRICGAQASFVGKKCASPAREYYQRQFVWHKELLKKERLLLRLAR
jgi:hypothetical protein